MLKRSSTFLIIQTAFLGDVILATALIEKLVSYHGSVQIDFLVKRGNEGLLANHPHLRKVYVWDKSKKYRSAFELIKIFRKNEYDYVINVHRHFTTGMISVLCGAKEVVGFDKNPWSLFYNRRVKHLFYSQHEVKRNQSLIAHLTDDTFAYPRLYPSEQEVCMAKAYMKGRYITISPGSVWFTKKVPLVKWIEFIVHVDKEIKIYLLGSQKENEDAAYVINKVKDRGNVYNLCGELNLNASAVLMKGAIMNYTNDSAPTHVASGIGAKVTSVYCSTDPIFGYGPIGEKVFCVKAQPQISCHPCTNHGKKNCPKGHFECGNNLRYEQFLETLF